MLTRQEEKEGRGELERPNGRRFGSLVEAEDRVSGDCATAKMGGVVSSDRFDVGFDSVSTSSASLFTLSLQLQSTHTASPAQSPRSPDIPGSPVLAASGSSLPCRSSDLVLDRGCGGSRRAQRRRRCGLTGTRMGPRSSTARDEKESPERQRSEGEETSTGSP
jgi:hypothetical protein